MLESTGSSYWRDVAFKLMATCQVEASPGSQTGARKLVDEGLVPAGFLL